MSSLAMSTTSSVEIPGCPGGKCTPSSVLEGSCVGLPHGQPSVGHVENNFTRRHFDQLPTMLPDMIFKSGVSI